MEGCCLGRRRDRLHWDGGRLLLLDGGLGGRVLLLLRDLCFCEGEGGARESCCPRGTCCQALSGPSTPHCPNLVAAGRPKYRTRCNPFVREIDGSSNTERTIGGAKSVGSGGHMTILGWAAVSFPKGPGCCDLQTLLRAIKALRQCRDLRQRAPVLSSTSAGVTVDVHALGVVAAQLQVAAVDDPTLARDLPLGYSIPAAVGCQPRLYPGANGIAILLNQ